MSLSENTITFGKYKNDSLENLIRDRKYCEWLVRQTWFQRQYEYLYNRIREYKPLEYFLKKPIKECQDIEELLRDYPYFYLENPNNLDLTLSDSEQICYRYYLYLIDTLREKITETHSCAISAPSKWLQKFEKETNISRNVFKEFLKSYELPNIPYIVEDIKKIAGIDYKGAKSFIIAKNNSILQENLWERILKDIYGEDISSQFKYADCIFDFINIKKNTLYECKIGIKDFDAQQYEKYKLVLGQYHIIYLIGTDCIVDIEKNTIYTTDPIRYLTELFEIPKIKEPNELQKIIIDFEVKNLKNIESYFK